MNHLNKIKISFNIFTLLIFSIITIQTTVACDGFALTLAQKAAQANYIFEAEVVDIRYFHHEEEPYTVHYLSIYKVFKGELPDTVELISYGGKTTDPVFGTVFIMPSHYFSGSIGNVSIFCTKKSKVINPATKQPHFNLTFPSRSQSYLFGNYPENVQKRYSEEAQARWHKRFTEQIYIPLQKLLSKEYIEKKPFLKKKVLNDKQSVTPIINIFSPASLPAGLLNDSSLLTIRGEGFGIPNESIKKGEVLFTDVETNADQTKYLFFSS